MNIYRKSQIPTHLLEFFEPAEIGLEPTPDAYVEALVEVFREVRRVLRADGTLWLNLGDSYASGGRATYRSGASQNKGQHVQNDMPRPVDAPGIKPKDLLGIPWMVAFALRADGWWLRSDIIWCLSGGTCVYARTQKGEMPMTIKDMVRLDPATVQLWNGERWTQVLGWNETPRPDRTYEIEFRSGQRVGCTAGHLWPTQRGNVRADEIVVGDVVARCQLPGPPLPKDPAWLPDDLVGWFIGLYIAEGSQSDGTINIASHTKEDARFAKLQEIASACHGYAAVHKTSENGCTVAINSPVLLGIINAYVSGRIASDKHLHPRCWQRSNAFLRSVLDGYLSGDGHFDAQNNRWRLGFCANDELVADIRTLCARLGISVRLRRYNHVFNGVEFPGYRGELRFSRSDHHNGRDDGEVIAIRKSRARKFWDIGVADEPHLFALASGVLTHNSKPNPMPESVTDRPTSAHEHVFLLAKSERYYFDQEAVKEPSINAGRVVSYDGTQKNTGHENATYPGAKPRDILVADGRNIRNVWTVATEPFNGAQLMRGASGGSSRTASPDCPLHGDQASQASMADRGARQAASPSARNLGTDDHLALGLFGERAPIETRHGEGSSLDNSGSPLPACGEIASAHNTENHRTDHVLSTSPHEKSGEGSQHHIGGNEPPPDSSANGGRTHESKTVVDSGAGGPPNCPSARTGDRNERMCTCQENSIIIDHFATFPPSLIEPCIKAGTSERGCCAKCGAPWKRETETESIALRPNSNSIRGNSPSHARAGGQPQRGSIAARTTTLGWSPSCRCGAAVVPCAVLDPFGGAGTTGMVADRLGRDCILIELNPAYAAMAERRIAKDAGMFADVSHVGVSP